jgi:site-specific DNA recombinase
MPDSVAKRGIIYCRVSTDEQRKSGYSIPSQIRNLQDKMKTDSVEPVCDPIIEAESGRDFQRKGLSKVMEFAIQHSIDYLYILDLDRLGRNVAETPYLMYKLKEEADVITRTIKEEFDFKQPIDFVLAVLKSFPGAVESIQLGERTQRGKIEKFRSGKWVGPIPRGYTKNAAGELAKVNILQGILVGIFRTFERTGSLKETTKIANEKYTQENGILSVSQIRAIITNPVYIGRPKYGAVEISNPSLAIIPPDLFEKLQTLIRRKNRRNKATSNVKQPQSILDDLASKYGIQEAMRVLDILSPFCPKDQSRMVGNGSKLLKRRGLKTPNFICQKCKFQRTIPSAADLDRFSKGHLSCPKCGVQLNSAGVGTLDGFIEYACKCCGFSFRHPQISSSPVPTDENSKQVKLTSAKHTKANPSSGETNVLLTTKKMKGTNGMLKKSMNQKNHLMKEFFEL